jgi:hypothetical protein
VPDDLIALRSCLSLEHLRILIEVSFEICRSNLLASIDVSDHVVKNNLEVLVGFSDISLESSGLLLVVSAGELFPGSTLVLEPGLDDLNIEAVGDDGISDLLNGLLDDSLDLSLFLLVVV